ncbi:MAG: PorT family protein [Sphingobacteriaceae bacterium]|nr:PorT family protein [Sphingobacteriaceae bacterium]
MRYKLALAIVLIPFLSISQESGRSFQLGFTLSPTISWLTDDGSKLVSDGAKPGFSYGVIADFGFAKNYFFSTAFTLTSLNSEAKIATGTNKYRLQYIEVPLSLKLKSNTSGMGRFYGQFGLGTGVNVSAKKDDSSGKGISISSDVNTFRLGLIAGGGAEWNVGRNLNVVTGVTFNNGFTKTFNDYDSKNPFVTLNLGVFF